MSKTNFFVTYLKSISSFINNLLEKNLNKLNFKNTRFLFKNNKITLTFVALFLIFLSYLLLPTFYKQSEVLNKIKTELQNKFELDFKFSQNLEYNFFPRPHFTTINSSIYDGERKYLKLIN